MLAMNLRVRGWRSKILRWTNLQLVPVEETETGYRRQERGPLRWKHVLNAGGWGLGYGAIQDAHLHGDYLVEVELGRQDVVAWLVDLARVDSKLALATVGDALCAIAQISD